MSRIDWKHLPRAYFKLDMMIDALKDTRSDARYSSASCASYSSRYTSDAANAEKDKQFFSLVIEHLDIAIHSLEEAQKLIENKYQ